jgi:hypothetical protein
MSGIPVPDIRIDDVALIIEVKAIAYGRYLARVSKRSTRARRARKQRARA